MSSPNSSGELQRGLLYVSQRTTLFAQRHYNDVFEQRTDGRTRAHTENESARERDGERERATESDRESRERGTRDEEMACTCGVGRAGQRVAQSVTQRVTQRVHGFHSLAPRAIETQMEATWRQSTTLSSYLSGGWLSASTRAAPVESTVEILSAAAATHNLGESHLYTLSERLQRRKEKVECGMRQPGMQAVLQKCEQPGESSLHETIARALWQLETSRALSDAIVEKRR